MSRLDRGCFFSISQAGQTNVIETASSTVTGSLRKELEIFLHEEIQSGEYDSRERVPWVTLRARVSKTFLHVDESGALRDSLNNFRQSAYETDHMHHSRVDIVI